MKEIFVRCERQPVSTDDQGHCEKCVREIAALAPLWAASLQQHPDARPHRCTRPFCRDHPGSSVGDPVRVMTREMNNSERRIRAAGQDPAYDHDTPPAPLLR